MKVEVITFGNIRSLNPPKESLIITVSKSNDWSRGLSPFYLGPCNLYGGYIAKNMENGWQFSKVYSNVIKDGEITEDYWTWAKNGWNDTFAHRYPMGKGAIPEFSLWDGRRLGYIDARKQIYIPVYYNAVKNTDAFKRLKEIYEQHVKEDKDLFLVDFDAYRHRMYNMTYNDVVNWSVKKMGHAFILAMALEDKKELSKYVNIEE